jgi:hypothetical protein
MEDKFNLNSIDFFAVEPKLQDYKKVKCKTVSMACLRVSRQGTKKYRGMETQLQIFLTSALDRGERSASRLVHLTLGEITSVTHQIAGWAGPGAGLDVVGELKNLLVGIDPRLLGLCLLN